ncbi:hypothetical protein BDAP_000918 [Binucleata daphniae]
MHHKAVEKIDKVIEKIENDINNPQITKSIFNIQVTQLSTLLIRYETLFSAEDDKENEKLKNIYKEYKQKLKRYKERIKMVAIEEPTINNNFESLDTNNVNNSIESEYMSSSARRVENFSFMALDSIDMLRKQKKIIESARERVKTSLTGLGVSDSVVELISNRYLTDYYFFFGGAILIILLLFLINYYVF